MAHSVAESHQKNENTAAEDQGTVAALISYLRRMRMDIFGQQEEAQLCSFCGQHGRCDCQTVKRGDDSAIEEDRSDTTEPHGEEAVSAIGQVNDTMRQILQEIMDIKESSQTKNRHAYSTVAHDKYQHVVDDLLAARSRLQELEDKLCWYENTLKVQEEEQGKRKNLKLQITVVPGDDSAQNGTSTLEHDLRLEHGNALKSESCLRSLDATYTDITQVKDMMSKLLQEITELRKDKGGPEEDAVAIERKENIDDTEFDEVMEALDAGVVHVKDSQGGILSSVVTSSEALPVLDKDSRKFVEMQTIPTKENQCVHKEITSYPNPGDAKVRLMADSQVQTVPIPRTREEVLRDLVQSGTQDKVASANQEGREPISDTLRQNEADSFLQEKSQEFDADKPYGLQPHDTVPDTSCEKVVEDSTNTKARSLGFFSFGIDAEKAKESNMDGRIFPTNFFGFAQKSQDEDSKSPINQLSNGFGLGSKLSRFKSWVGDSIASTASQIAGRSEDKASTETDGPEQMTVNEELQQKQRVPEPGRLCTSGISEPVSPHGQSYDHPISSESVTQTPVHEPPFTATYVTVQNVSPHGTLFHLLQETGDVKGGDGTREMDPISSSGNSHSGTSQPKCQTHLQECNTSGQHNVPFIQTSLTEVVPQERIPADSVCHTPPVQRKVMRRSASLPRQAAGELRSAHGHVPNVGVITSTSQQQTQSLPRKGILHQKQHVCDVSSDRPELWRRRGSNCVQVDTQEISSDAAASDDSKTSYIVKPQKHVTYSPYVYRKIISPRHSPKHKPKFFIPSLVEYDDSTSDDDFKATYNKFSTSRLGTGIDKVGDDTSQKARSHEQASMEEKLSSNPNSRSQTSSRPLQMRSSRSVDGTSDRLGQTSSQFLQVPGMVPSVRPKMRHKEGSANLSRKLDGEDWSSDKRHPRERTSELLQQSKHHNRKQPVPANRQTGGLDCVPYRWSELSPEERKQRERELRHQQKGRPLRTEDGDARPAHSIEGGPVGRNRKDQTVAKQGKSRSPQLERSRSMERNKGDRTVNLTSGTKERGTQHEPSLGGSSMRRSRRKETEGSTSGEKDSTSDSKPKYLQRSRSLGRGKRDETANIASGAYDREERPSQLRRSNSLGRRERDATVDRTVGVSPRLSHLQQSMPIRRGRREDDITDMGRWLFWNQVAAKSPQLKPRIIHSPQQIYGSAYQVEEETSSDSDDEVLQQYKRSMSQHSVRSKASVRSHRSKKGDKLASPEEKPEAEAAYQPIEEPDYHRPTRSKPADPYSRLEKGERDEEMVESDLEPDHASYLEYEEGLDNEAYDSEGANGAYGDQVSYHSQEKRKRLKSRRHRPEGRSMSSQLNKEGHGGLSSGEESVTTCHTGDVVSADEMSVASSALDPNWKDKAQDRGYYDVDQPYDEDSQLISKCGVLEVAFAYDAPNRKMTVSIVQARDVPSKDRGGTGGYQVHMVLLPTKKQRCKTKVRQGNNPVFKESFRFSRVNQDELPDMGVRFRLYACERMKKERLIGEKLVGFSNLKLDQRESMTVSLPLEPRSNLSGGDSQFSLSGLSRSDSGSSSQSLTHAGGVPELLVGLAYNATTGRLSVEVIKGSHFRNMAMNRAPDTYVKICLMASNGQELSRSKTSIRRGQPNPVYKETFIFQVALFQLSDVTLMFSVYNKRGMKRKEMIGWFSLGLNNSGEEELNHWQDMRESKGQQVCRWHVLLES